jgi:GNAT superfamily N-acetyltransferase
MVDKLNVFSSDNFSIKKTTKDNIDEIYNFKLDTIINNNDISEEEYVKITKYISADIKSHIDDYNMVIIENKVVGTFCFYEDSEGYLLDEIYIISDYRGFNIGSKIIEKIKNLCLEKRKTLYLWVYKTNEGALRLYNKLGFSIFIETETRYKMKFN